MGKRKPFISVIIIVFNESKNIARCLSRVRNQLYPQKKIEIVLVDDDSTDNTVEIAKKYNVKVIRSGYKNCERAKSIGMQHARGDLIFFLDADVFLVKNDYINKTVDLFLLYPSVVAAQSIRWDYHKDDYIINRYCNLFGIVDPVVLFLGKRGTLGATEKVWFHQKDIIQKGNYYEIAKFSEENLPTVGSNGYMVRKKAIFTTSWKPFFFHLDTAFEMVKHKMNQFALTTLPVKHDYVHSFVEYHKKAYRNITLFHKYQSYRTYGYDIKPLKLIIALLLMLTVVYPLIQSIMGFAKKNDLAWFLHPILCITVPLVYSFATVKWNIKKSTS